MNVEPVLWTLLCSTKLINTLKAYLGHLSIWFYVDVGLSVTCESRRLFPSRSYSYPQIFHKPLKIIRITFIEKSGGFPSLKGDYLTFAIRLHFANSSHHRWYQTKWGWTAAKPPSVLTWATSCFIACKVHRLILKMLSVKPSQWLFGCSSWWVRAMVCWYSVSYKGLVVVIFTINLYMTHTCTNTPLLIVFKEQYNCAILLIYCNILFIYVFLRWQKVMCHVQRFNNVSVHSWEDKSVVWSCNAGM